MKTTEQTYIDVQRAKALYEARIKDLKYEILKITLFRERLEQLIEIVDHYDIDDTNRDLLFACASKLNEKLSI